jgi:hypothetical protein
VAKKIVVHDVHAERQLVSGETVCTVQYAVVDGDTVLLKWVHAKAFSPSPDDPHGQAVGIISDMEQAMIADAANVLVVPRKVGSDDAAAQITGEAYKPCRVVPIVDWGGFDLQEILTRGDNHA